MKKMIFWPSLLLTLSATASVSATAMTEDDFAGPRIGIGYSLISLDAVADNDSVSSFDADSKGVKLELGYDLNRIIGFDASYETVNDSLSNINNNSDFFDTSIIKVGTDIGYAFYSQNVFFKPYAKVGFVSLSSDDLDENAVFAGIGLRYQFNNLYADLSGDGFFLDGEDYDYYKYIQTSLTIGYKF
ncbi:MAG: outer membrane beta-barrel protein [Psychromonas sp.]